MKSKPIRILALLALLFVTQCIACTFDSEPLETMSLANIDITGAISLVIAPAGSDGRVARSKEETPTELFKITEDGYLMEVAFTDAGGEEYTSTYDPVVVYNVNDNYVIVGFGFNQYNIYEGYLVRKSDGAVFLLTSINSEGYQEGGFLYKQQDGYANHEVVSTDAMGNIYFVSWSSAIGDRVHQIFKLDIADPEYITSTTLTPTTEYVRNFVVDSTGNVAYWAEESATRVYLNRIKKANGGLYNLPRVIGIKWTGFDGNIYYTGYDESQHNKIFKIVIDVSGQVSITESAASSVSLPMDPYSYQTFPPDLTSICRE